jgi:hypothetical protein
MTMRCAVSRHGIIGLYFINDENSDNQMISGNFMMPEACVPKSNDFSMMVVRAILYMLRVLHFE